MYNLNVLTKMMDKLTRIFNSFIKVNGKNAM